MLPKVGTKNIIPKEVKEISKGASTLLVILLALLLLIVLALLALKCIPVKERVK